MPGFRPRPALPIRQRAQTNTAGVTSKDRTSIGPRPDGGSGGETPTFEGWVPVGGIIMYSGAFADIPANWHLCDGTDGTPDLTDRFVLATNTEADVAQVGGTKKHRHNLIAADTPAGTATVVAASAGTPAGTNANTAPNFSGTSDAHTTTAVQSGAGTTVVTGPASHAVSGSVDAHTHTFTGNPMANHTHLLAGKTALGESEAGLYGANDTLPPFFKLAFIQRIE